MNNHTVQNWPVRAVEDSDIIMGYLKISIPEKQEYVRVAVMPEPSPATFIAEDSPPTETKWEHLDLQVDWYKPLGHRLNFPKVALKCPLNKAHLLRRVHGFSAP